MIGEITVNKMLQSELWFFPAYLKRSVHNIYIHTYIEPNAETNNQLPVSYHY